MLIKLPARLVHQYTCIRRFGITITGDHFIDAGTWLRGLGCIRADINHPPGLHPVLLEWIRRQFDLRILADLHKSYIFVLDLLQFTPISLPTSLLREARFLIPVIEMS